MAYLEEFPLSKKGHGRFTKLELALIESTLNPSE